MTTDDPNRVYIFDTTLRDGEQAPGFSMNIEEKVLFARQLERLGVDVIEAGFAASSSGDFEAIEKVSRAVYQPVVLSLARTRQSDVEQALQSVIHAKNPGIHIFIATSDIHLEKKLRMSRNEVVDAACHAIEFAKKNIDYIEFSAEDASRSDHRYLCEIFSEVIRYGATVINVPDTTGWMTPHEYGRLFKYLMKNTFHGFSVRWSAHCHDDLGMATANSLAAVESGVRQVECTINGIGERAGNTAMEEIVMALKTRSAHYRHRGDALVTCVNSEHIYATSQLLSRITGISVQPNKAIIGENAFKHEAGIHQDGGLKDELTYQIINPADVGCKSDWLVLGKHSGRHALVERLKLLGINEEEIDMNKTFERFKQVADRKKEIHDEDLLAIATEEQVRIPEQYELLYMNVTASSMAVPHATVKLRVGNEELIDDCTGDGMVDACFKVIAKIVNSQPKLERYIVKAITGGTDALGEVSCLISLDGIFANGHGSHTDIIQASAIAYINALNKLEYRKKHLVLKN